MRRAFLSTCALLALCVTAARAQHAPLYIEPGHWTYDAIRRLHVAGVAPAAADPTVAPITRAHARHVFAHADSVATARAHEPLAQLARGFLALLHAESDTTGVLAQAQLRAGWTAAAGDARAGQGYVVGEDFTGAQAVEDASAPALALRAHGLLQPWLSWNVHAGLLAGEAELPAATLGVRAGAFDVWLGRRRLRYGVGYGGGTVLSTGGSDNPALAHRTYASLDGIGIHVREPFRFPWLFRHLGPIRIEVAGGMLPRNGNVEDPYVAFGRLFGSPFTDRFTLGINRGAIFGGAGNPVTAGRLLGLVIGLHGGETGEFENQIFSTIASVRPPLGALAVELYAEVGMDDTAGAISDMPGIVAGLNIDAVPAVPALSLGVEHTDFPHSCCGNPLWFRSVFFRGSWGDEGRLFAHPLGGHGRETLARAALDLPQHGLLLRGSAFVRMRGEENLFAPERTGRSRGGSATLEYMHHSGVALRADGWIERAAAWDSHRASILLSYSFVRLRRP